MSSDQAIQASQIADSRNESVALYFREGSSDKEYQAQLLSKDNGYVVNFQYGRRGGTLQAGTKTAEPLDFDKAKKIYNKLVAEKMGKGYTPAVSGAAFQDTPKADTFTGITPQLLNAITMEQGKQLLKDDAWYMELKFDGERRMLKAENHGESSIEITGINRNGLAVALPKAIADAGTALSKTCGGLAIDGEIIGNKLWVFDVLEIGGEDIRGRTAFDRSMIAKGLSALLGRGQDASIEIANSAYDTESKTRMFEAVLEADLEGVVFKRKNSLYVSGRPSSEGDQLKLKFWESASLIVSKVNNDRRSVAVAAYKDGSNVEMAELGNVTIPPNKMVPDVGDVVEIKYLYAHRDGALSQPEFLNKRSDIRLEDCTLAQLKYKVVMGEQIDIDAPPTARKAARP